LTGRLSGRYRFTQRDLSLSERTHHHLTLAASHRVDHWVPGLFLRAPLDDDLREVLDFVAGVTLEYRFY
jgi:hypothetical protein